MLCKTLKIVDIRLLDHTVFKPGMIVGNANTPRWLTIFTSLVPDSSGWGNIHQEEVARAFVAHLDKRVALQKEPVVSYSNKDMKLLLLDRSTKV